MHRFYLAPEHCRGPVLYLTGGEAHHAAHVLRLRPGDAATVLDGCGGIYECRVQEVSRSNLSLQVMSKESIVPAPCQLTLIQAVPKGKIMETIIQKAVELGAVRIVPLLSERVVVQYGPKEAESKAAKWNVVAVEAIKQCGAAWLPHVETPITPSAFLKKQESFELPLVASLRPHSLNPREYFKRFESIHHRKPASACVWIGPEGDFSAAELDSIEAGGAAPITLGPTGTENRYGDHVLLVRAQLRIEGLEPASCLSGHFLVRLGAIQSSGTVRSYSMCHEVEYDVDA